MSNVKQSVIARLSRLPSNMTVLRPALDKLSEAELIALNHVLLHIETENLRLKSKVRRGF